MKPGRPRPRLAVVGPHVGLNPGRVTTQGEVLAERLVGDGWSVLAVSSRSNRWARLLDITATLLARGRSLDVMVLDVYGGRSFVVEDVASLIARRSSVRLVMRLHGGALPEFRRRFPAWFRRVVGRAEVLTTPSRYLKSSLEGHGLRIRLLPNIVDAQQLGFTLRERPRARLLWMRAFEPVYAPLLPVRVLARVRQRHPNATLTMAGEDKGHLRGVRAEAARLGVGEAVRFPGFLDPAGKSAELASADVFLNTTRCESFGVANLEAGAAGLCLVSTAVGEMPLLWTDGHDALLVPADDESAMAEAVCRVLEEPGLARRLSGNARELSQRFTWERVRPEVEALIEEVWAS